MVDEKSGFLYFDKNESICYFLHWEHYFKHITQKYNNMNDALVVDWGVIFVAEIIFI